MKNIFKTALLMVCALAMFTSCSDDNGSNPELGGPYELTLYAPQMAQYDIDLAQSQSLDLVCTYPNYGFPTTVNYSVEIALNEGMTDAIEVGSYSSPTMSVPTKDIAIALTTLAMNAGKTEEDFPMELPAYLRVVARMVSADNLTLIEKSRVNSNVVKLNNVKLEFSLPPVLPPTEMYIIGDFCGNNWDN
ncbi:MAG: SusE domain-containing protein, partial [Muribaculaceae bacterium]|nr:SusE domain-containing protein [Muribaculaceae bacterium]